MNQLQDFQIQEATLKHAQSLCVVVLKEGPAVGFYKKMGAKIIQARRDEIGGKQYAEYLMGWEQITQAHNIS